jgi:AraC family transcriptional regulator
LLIVPFAQEPIMSDALITASPQAPFEMDLVTRLLAKALSVLDNDRSAARLHIEQAYTVARRDVEAPPSKGVLAAWQVRRIEQFVQAGIETPLRIKDAADSIRLSPSYFSRAFKTSKGVAYSDFVTQQRILRAKQLLLTTADPIAEIALACGFADQSHLTRLFHRDVGVPPRAWRRQYVRGSEATGAIAA